MGRVSWTNQVVLKNGAIGEYLGRCAITGKHRVMTPNTRGAHVQATVWLLNDEGCASDRIECGEDYARAA